MGFSQDNILTGKWKLIGFDEMKGKSFCAPTDNVVLNLKDSATKGTIKGRSLCNDVGGTYNVKPNGEISASYLGGTMVMCVGDPQFCNAFGNSWAYTKANDTLTIFYDKDSKKLIFVKLKQ
jgi:heat shock protein HslJ